MVLSGTGLMECEQLETEILCEILTSAFLSVIIAVHLSLGCRSRSTVYQVTPPLNLLNGMGSKQLNFAAAVI